VPELIVPTVRLHAEWLEAHEEWGPGAHEDGFGLRPSDDVGSPPGFAAWVRRLLDQADRGKATAEGRVPCTYRWIVVGSEVLGGIALRHELNERVALLGHIGYGVRPSARGRGLATWALGRMLDEARALSLDRVLLVCEEGNIASARTIERLGGALEGVQDSKDGTVRRYWITL
jgi:predicted acetyltransferase